MDAIQPPGAEERALDALLGPLGEAAAGQERQAAAYPALLVTLAFLRHCEPGRWGALAGMADLSAGDGPGLLLREIGATADDALADRGLPGGAAASVAGLQLRSVPALAEVMRAAGQLGADAAGVLLRRHAAALPLAVTGIPFTPPEVARLMAGLAASPLRLPAYDPFMRTGELLHAAATAGAAPAGLRGDGPVPGLLPLAAMRLALDGGPPADLRARSGAPWEQPGRPVAGTVLIAPPFGPAGPGAGHLAWIRYALECLAPGGRAAVLMPRAAGESPRPAQHAVRAELAEQGAIDAVIMLPRGIFPASAAGADLWVLRSPAGPAPPVLFADATRMVAASRGSRTLAPAAAAQITGACLHPRDPSAREPWPFGGGGVAVAVSLGDIRAARHSLSPAAWLARHSRLAAPAPAPPAPAVLDEVAARAAAARRLGEKGLRAAAALLRGQPPAAPQQWPQVPLAEVCDILVGPSYSYLGAGERDADGTVPIVMPRHMKDGRITAAGLDLASEETAQRLSRYRLAPGDILCVRTGTMGGPVLAGDQQDGWLFTGNLFRLRVTSPERADPRYLLACLDAPATLEWIRGHAARAAQPSLTAQSLSQLPVALPPLAEQQQGGGAIAALDDAIAAGRAYLAAAAAARAALAEGVTGRALPPPPPRGTPARPRAARLRPGPGPRAARRAR